MFKSINKIIRVLILSDIALLTGLGFVAPVFAIFIANNIQGGDVRVVGFASSVYWIVLSVVLIPVGRYLDHRRGSKDDLYFIIIGNILTALAFLGYMLAELPSHIYFLQAVYAIGMGMNIPGYTSIFTKNVDKGKEAFSWGTRASFIGIGAGIAGSLGGLVVHYFGFNTLFLGAGALLFLSAFLPLLMKKELVSNDKNLSSSLTAKIINPSSQKI